jgi:hypothetical protein
MVKAIGPKVRNGQFILDLAHAKIYKYNDGYRVTSPAEVNGKGKEFRVLNLTTEPAQITLLHQIVGRGVGPFMVPAQSMLTIPLAKGAWGSQTYSVTMETGGGFVTAQANSDPVIIIDPPCP